MEITKQQTVKIKGIAVLMLLFHHLFLNSERAGMCSYITGRVGEQILIQVALLGKICVSIFLILSGYGINESSKNIQGGVLLKKQCFRIFNLMKVYWIIFSIAFVGIFVGLKYQFKEIYSSCIDFCADFIGMAYLYGGDTLNGAWWYMTVIIIAYLVFPTIRYMGEKIKGLVITLCTGIIIIFMLFFPIGGDAGKLDFIIWLVPFMMGVLWSQNKRKLSGLLNLSKARIILINVFILLLCLVRLKLHTYNFDFLFASVFIILLMNFSIWENGILGKMLEIFGRYSYIIYLFHSFLIVYLSKWVYIWKIPIIVYIIFSVVCLCISVILDRIVKLCFRWRNKNEYKKCQN